MTKVKTFGPLDQRAHAQLIRCTEAGDAEYAVLSADHHVGYSMPIGGTVAYEYFISPSGVGYDIGCGNKAVRTDIKIEDLGDIRKIMDEIVERVSFGVGRTNKKKVDDIVLQHIKDAKFEPQRKLYDLAVNQLGTVGSGNHYVDLFKDENGFVWIGVHFGSRGFGHKTASGFIALNQGKEFHEHANEGEMDSPPILFDVRTDLGQAYIEAMTLAGEYAYAGRNAVVEEVLDILQTRAVEEIHNHHNFAWQEEHYGKKYWVVRKGCTPAFPGQLGFVGSNMMDNSVILRGIDSDTSKEALYTTVHGAGRALSRSQAKKKIDWEVVQWEAGERGVILKGGGADEAPDAYKKLNEVLAYHEGTIEILHQLTPVGVAMAGKDIYDPYKD
jgi:tRNA-splicing ligase RtcB